MSSLNKTVSPNLQRISRNADLRANLVDAFSANAHRVVTRENVPCEHRRRHAAKDINGRGLGNTLGISQVTLCSI